MPDIMHYMLLIDNTVVEMYGLNLVVGKLISFACLVLEFALHGILHDRRNNAHKYMAIAVTAACCVLLLIGCYCIHSPVVLEFALHRILCC